VSENASRTKHHCDNLVNDAEIEEIKKKETQVISNLLISCPSRTPSPSALVRENIY